MPTPYPDDKAFEFTTGFSSLFELLLVGNRLVTGGLKKIRWKFAGKFEFVGFI
jgi:hypothetical protein